jgi:hypothetical protein
MDLYQMLLAAIAAGVGALAITHPSVYRRLAIRFILGLLAILVIIFLWKIATLMSYEAAKPFIDPPKQAAAVVAVNTLTLSPLNMVLSAMLEVFLFVLNGIAGAIERHAEGRA